MTDNYGPIWGNTFLAWVETSEGLVAVDTGWDVAKGDAYEGSDIEALVQATERAGKPLTHILLTHDNWDHRLNLPLLHARWPDARLCAHPNSSIPPTQPLAEGATLVLGGVRFVAMHTPGHSQQRDELCYYLPDFRFLFSGDLAQPQGPSYALANGPSPVPYFYFGDDYRRSLERLIALDAAHMRTGHGQLLGPEQARQWLRVTLATVARIEELAITLTERYPTQSSDWLAELLYDHLVDERHFGTRAGSQRKRQSSYEGLTDYERFDRPGLLWAIEQAKAVS